MTPKERAAMQQALNLIEDEWPEGDEIAQPVIDALREALEQPVSEDYVRCKGCDLELDPRCLDESGVCASCGWPVWPSENFNGHAGFRPVSEMVAEHKQDPKKGFAIEKAMMRKTTRAEKIARPGVYEAQVEFEKWWEHEGQEFLYALNTTTDDDIKLVAEFAWKNGAYKAEQPVSQEPWDTSDTAYRLGGSSMEQEPWKCGCGANLYIDENGCPASKAEQPVNQEPVAVVEITYGREPECYVTGNVEDLPEGVFKLYTSPQPVKEVELTDDEIKEASLQAGMQEHYMGFHSGFLRFARAVIAAHKEKNK